MIELIRRYAVARFVASAVVGVLTGMIFVCIIWLLVKAFHLVV